MSSTSLFTDAEHSDICDIVHMLNVADGSPFVHDQMNTLSNLHKNILKNNWKHSVEAYQSARKLAEDQRAPIQQALLSKYIPNMRKAAIDAESAYREFCAYLHQHQTE
jgi:hypothetical protein